MNDDQAENEMVRALLDPLGGRADFDETVRHMTGHARHRRPEEFSAACVEATRTLRTMPPPRRRRRWKVFFLSTIGLLAGAAFFVPRSAREEFRLLLVSEMDQLPVRGSTAFGGARILRDRVVSRVSPRDAEILVGDSNQPDQVGRWEGLALSEPLNPGRYADHALAHLKNYHKLPYDFVEAGHIIDPGNGWYDYVAGLTELNPLMSSSPGTGAKERGTDLLARAATAPRFEDPTRVTWNERLSLLPKERLWADLIANRHVMEHDTPKLPPRVIPVSALAILHEEAEWAPRVGKSPIESVLISLSVMDLALQSARDLEDLQSVSYFHRALWRSRSLTYSFLDPEQEKLMLRVVHECGLVSHATAGGWTAPTSYLARRTSFADPGPHIDPALLKPGVAAEWAMHERLICWGTVLVATALLAMNLAVRQSHRGLAPLADRVGQLLRRSDQAWLHGISLGLPLAIYLAATRWPGHGLITTPLAEANDPRFMLLAVLQVSCVVAVPLLALEVARWRLAVRGKALGMAGRGFHLGMIPLAMVLFSMAGAVALPWIGPAWAAPKWPMLGLAGGTVLAAGWLVGLAIWHFLAPAESFTERLVRLRMAWSPVLATLLVTAAGMIALRAHEMNQVAINRFEKSPRVHAGHPTAADQIVFEEWRKRLIGTVRDAARELEKIR